MITAQLLGRAWQDLHKGFEIRANEKHDSLCPPYLQSLGTKRVLLSTQSVHLSWWKVCFTVKQILSSYQGMPGHINPPWKGSVEVPSWRKSYAQNGSFIGRCRAPCHGFLHSSTSKLAKQAKNIPHWQSILSSTWAGNRPPRAEAQVCSRHGGTDACLDSTKCHMVLLLLAASTCSVLLCK